MESQYQGEKTVLFGGSGFLGPYILERHPQMISVGRTPPPVPNRHIAVESLAHLQALRDVEFDKVIYIIGNTDHYSMEVEQLPAGNLGAFGHHPVPLIQTLEQLKHFPIKKFIQFSSVLVYREQQPKQPVSEESPIDPYRNRYVMSKYMVEELAQFYSRWVPIITARMANLYGPTPLQRFDLIHIVLNKILENGRAQIWSTKPKRDFIYVEDAAEAIVKLLETEYTGLLNLGTGVMTSVADVIDRICEVTGCPIDVLDTPVQGPLEFQCDISTLQRLIDWKPQVSVAEGVRRTYEKMLAYRGYTAASAS